MTKSNPYLLDFKIDKLTDSILNRISGDSFRTEISLLTKSDLKTIPKSKGWLFDWKFESPRAHSPLLAAESASIKKLP